MLKDKNDLLITNIEKNQEIDLLKIVKFLWSKRNVIYKFLIIFFLIGVIMAFLSEDKYTSSTTFIVQKKGGNSLGSSLGGLAEIAGVNISDIGGSEISPELYPQIINSTIFLKELLETPITVKEREEKVTLRNFYKEVYEATFFSKAKKYTIGLPSIILKKINGKVTKISNNNKLINVTEEEYELIEKLQNQINIEVNKKKGYLLIKTTMSEKIATAELTLRIKELLQEYIINFKTQKSKNNLNFIKKRYEENQKKFKTVQYELANYKDRNQSFSSARSEIKFVVLQSEYDLAYAVYLELSKKLESQKIKVKENTPVFTTLKPVTIPLKKSNSRKITVVLLWLVIGFSLGLLTIFINYFMALVKSKWEKIEI